MTRLYRPLTPADLTTLATGALTVEEAFAVTSDVRALAPDGDEELFEHLATQFAAAAAGTPAKRVVIAAVDVPEARLRPATDAAAPVPGRVAVEGEVTLRDVACFLVGDEGEVVGDDAELELSWYDASEIDAVRSLV